MGTSHGNERPTESARPAIPPTARATACDLYAPGHQMHYRHQGTAVRSPSRAVSNAFVDDSLVILVLDDGVELRWRHHDPDRLRRMLEAVPTKRVAYPEQHALRVGPYWFNCAREGDDWQDCRTTPQ
jgi:hypothetical protein